MLVKTALELQPPSADQEKQMVRPRRENWSLKTKYKQVNA